MKKIICLLLCLLTPIIHAQKNLTTKTGHIYFEASVPLFEPVAAKNNNVLGELNTKTGQFTVLVKMKSFHFKLPLMEAHFNSKYLETEKYPNATFVGKIKNFSYTTISDTQEKWTLDGELKIHGVNKKIHTSITLKKIGNQLEIKSHFVIPINEFEIEIPHILHKKIAKNAIVEGVFLLN